jgi:hypothetical protein
MILTAHQPTYLPWLGLFHKIALADQFCWFNVVQLEHYSFEHRNKIKTAAGPIWLSVPLLIKDHQAKKASEIRIDNSKNWRQKHWKSIYFNYRKAPYFDQYAEFFENVYRQKWDTLHELNGHLLHWFLQTLKIKVRFSQAKQLDLIGSKSDLVLEMCQKLRADGFIFGKLGRDYAQPDAFRQAGIMVHFQDYQHPCYNQLYGKFEPYLSVIDLLFNEGPKSREIIMSGNITKQELIKELWPIKQ